MSTFEAAFTYRETNESSNLVSRFSQLINEQLAVLNRLNFSVAAPAPSVLDSFTALVHERQIQILANLRFQNDLLLEASADPVQLPKNEPSQFTRDKELPYLMTALRKCGLRMGDSSIMNYIEDEDIIEIYDSRGVQLYRSWSCYKYCNYSLAELLVYDWDTLYLRPSWVAKKLHQLAPLLFQPGAGTMAYDLPEYTLTERLLKNDRILLFKMKYASPLICQDTHRTIAFITTGKMTPMQNENASGQIHII